MSFLYFQFSPKAKKTIQLCYILIMIPQFKLFSYLFWENWRYQKDISKWSDLYIYFWMAFKSLITLLFYFPIYFPIIDTMCSFFCHLTFLISTCLNQTSVSWVIEFLLFFLSLLDNFIRSNIYWNYKR